MNVVPSPKKARRLVEKIPVSLNKISLAASHVLEVEINEIALVLVR